MNGSLVGFLQNNVMVFRLTLSIQVNLCHPYSSPVRAMMCLLPLLQMRQCRGAEGSPVWVLRTMSTSLVSLPGTWLWGPYVVEMLVIRQLNDNF